MNVCKLLFIVLTLGLANINPTLANTNTEASKPASSSQRLNCQSKKQQPIAYGRCLDEHKERLDRHLQTWVNNQVFQLTENAKSSGRKSALTMFNKAQNNFVKFREDNCRWYYLARLPNDDAHLHYKHCYLELTQARINELTKLK